MSTARERSLLADLIKARDLAQDAYNALVVMAGELEQVRRQAEELERSVSERGVPAPIDWPARFRRAAEVAETVKGRRAAVYYGLHDVAAWLEVQPPDVVEAIGRALQGQE